MSEDAQFFAPAGVNDEDPTLPLPAGYQKADRQALKDYLSRNNVPVDIDSLPPHYQELAAAGAEYLKEQDSALATDAGTTHVPRLSRVDEGLWISAAAALGERAARRCDAYASMMTRLAQQIESDGQVWEILERTAADDLKPVRGLRYTAEHPFSWSAAMYLEAASGGCKSVPAP